MRCTFVPTGSVRPLAQVQRISERKRLLTLNTISFMSANYVARQVGYHMTGGWSQGDKATNAYFRPLQTFEARFDEIVRTVPAMGFRAMDIWVAHLNPQWATAAHIAAAQRVLARHGVQVASLAGYFGTTVAEVEASCRLAHALGAPVLGGGTGLLAADRASLAAMLHDYKGPS